MNTKLNRDALFKANLLEFITQSAIATDGDGQIFYWSQASEELYGWREEEVIERNILDVLPTYVSRRQAEGIMATVRQDLAWFGEMQVQDKAGNRFLAHIVDLPIRNADGHLLAILGLSTRAAHGAPTQDNHRDGGARKSLTVRQLEVLQLIGQGCTNAEIAEQLALSTNTVKIHVSAILARLGLKTRSQAAVVAGQYN